MKSGAVTRDGRLLHTALAPSGFSLAPDALLRSVTAGIQSMSQSIGSNPLYVVVGFPGAVDPEYGVVLLPGKLQVEGFPFVPQLRSQTQLPVMAENDGRLSILAEIRYGKARDLTWAVSITIGTGVGSGVMLDGRVLRDPHLQFGTQASHIVQEAGSQRLCITGARGTANILCSATALAVSVRDGLCRGLPSVLNETYFDNPHAVDFEAVIGAVEQGDPLCLDAMERWTENLGRFLVSVVHMYAPQMIILSGGATKAASHFLDNVREYVRRHVYRYPPDEPVPIEVSGLATYCGVLGAAARAWEILEKTG